MDVHRPLRWLRAASFEWLGLNARARRRLDGSRAALLMYHRVLPREQVQARAVEPGMYVTPGTFSRHLEWLEAEFRVLPLSEIVERLEQRRALPPGACALTFDDGWRDNLEHALPALQARGMPATLFAVTERVGTCGGFWPDEVQRRMQAAAPELRSGLADRIGAPRDRDPAGAVLRHLKSLPESQLQDALAVLREATPETDETQRELLDWDELAALERGGVDVESHAATHAILTKLDASGVERELTRSLAQLQAHGLGRHRLLAYPSGQADARIHAQAAKAGYRAAITTEMGLAGFHSNLLALPRLGLHDDVSRTRAEFHFAVPGRAT